jgi:hypothetical protein
MENYLYVGIITKFVQNGEENGQRSQVDVAGGLGPTWPRQLAPQGSHPVSYLPHVSFLQQNFERDINKNLESLFGGYPIGNIF